jgi:hypothetical protein
MYYLLVTTSFLSRLLALTIGLFLVGYVHVGNIM